MPRSTYALLLDACRSSSASNTVREASSKTGYQAWQSLLKDYKDGTIQFATAETIRAKIKQIRLGNKKEVRGYINKFKNLRLQLRIISPPQDLPDYEAAAAFIKGLKGSRYKALVNTYQAELWDFKNCVAKLKTMAGMHASMCSSSSSEDDSEDDDKKVTSRRGTYSGKPPPKNHPSYQAPSHPFQSYGLNIDTTNPTLEGLQKLHQIYHRIPDNVWRITQRHVQLQYITWKHSLNYNRRNNQFRDQPSTTNETANSIPQQYIPFPPPNTKFQMFVPNIAPQSQHQMPIYTFQPTHQAQPKRQKTQAIAVETPPLQPPTKNQRLSQQQYYEQVMNGKPVPPTISSKRRKISADTQPNQDDENDFTDEIDQEGNPTNEDIDDNLIPVIDSKRAGVENANIQTVTDSGCGLSTAGQGWICLQPL